MGELLGEKKLEERLEEIEDIVRRLDTRWDDGFFVYEQQRLPGAAAQTAAGDGIADTGARSRKRLLQSL